MIIYRTLFVVFSFVAIQTLPKQLKNPVVQRALEQERETVAQKSGVQEVNLGELQSQVSSDLYTQTQAHLQLNKVRELIQEKYKNDVVPYFDVISRVITKEVEFKNSHWAFYHGTSQKWMVWQDVLTKLTNHFKPSNAKEGQFVFLRTKAPEGLSHIKAKEFLVKELRAHGLIDDQNEDQGMLLSTNLALFGNVGFLNEATWSYFIQEQSHAVLDRSFYESIMNEFGLSHTYIDELMGLVNMLPSKHESLLQIFIPKNIVDDVAYLAWVTGIPAHDEVIDWVRTNVKKKKYKAEPGKSPNMMALASLKGRFKKEQENNPLFKEMLEAIEKGDYSINAYLKIYCNKPEELHGANYAQARLLLTDDILLNPRSGVLIFRHTDVDHRSMEKYEERLDQIIQKILAENREKMIPSLPQPRANINPAPVVKPVTPTTMPQPRQPGQRPLKPIIR